MDLQLLSQCGSTYNCLSRSVPEIHSHVAGTLSKNKQQHLLHLHLSRSLADRLGITGDFTTNFLHSSWCSAFCSINVPCKASAPSAIVFPYLLFVFVLELLPVGQCRSVQMKAIKYLSHNQSPMFRADALGRFEHLLLHCRVSPSM